MQKVLVVVDMQNDFIDGALGTPQAVSIVPLVKKKIENFSGLVLFTRDTHENNYLNTQEGRNLPVLHCIRNTYGWQIHSELRGFVGKDSRNPVYKDSRNPVYKDSHNPVYKDFHDPIDKNTFGSAELGEILRGINETEGVESITFAGLCTDICVISNAMIAKAFLPEVPVYVDASCCAGTSPQSHENALNAMKVCQINII